MPKLCAPCKELARKYKYMGPCTNRTCVSNKAWIVGPAFSERVRAFRLSQYTLDELIEALQRIREDQAGDSVVRVWHNDAIADLFAIGHNGASVDLFTENDLD